MIQYYGSKSVEEQQVQDHQLPLNEIQQQALTEEHIPFVIVEPVNGMQGVCMCRVEASKDAVRKIERKRDNINLLLRHLSMIIV